MDEQTIIKESIIDVFKDNGYNDLAAMKQRDFDHIGEQIKKKSGTLISGTTVKRLAYGEFSRVPQVATLNAIANYFNYQTWQDYKAEKIRKAKAQQHETEAGPVKETAATTNRWSGVKYLYVLGALIIIGIGTYFFGTMQRTINKGETAQFSIRKNTSNDIPNSVVFSYNIDDVEADSFFIQQSWDINRRVRIYKGKYTQTDIYYEPGYHIAKLVANDSVIRTVDVSIPTDRWFFYAIDNIPKYTPEYIKVNSFVNNGIFGLTVDQLENNKVDITKDKRYHYVYYPTEMNVSSGDFIFKTRVRMKELRSSGCPYIELELFCQRSFMVMRSTTKGCAHEGLVQFGEKVMRGSDTDLLPVSFDVSQWTDIEITVKDNLAAVKINDKEVFSTRFVTDTKNLAGLGYISNGLCEVDKVELIGLDGRVMYVEDF